MVAERVWQQAWIMIGSFDIEEAKVLRFLSEDGWGKLAKATRLTVVLKSVPVGSSQTALVNADQPFAGEWGRYVISRADLFKIADFDGIEADGYGNPLVLAVDYACCACHCVGHLLMGVHAQPLCSACGDNDVVVLNRSYIGPSVPALRKLWHVLPASTS